MTATAVYAYALGFYFTLMILIGVYHLWKIETGDEYLIANWNVGFWQTLGTTVATWTGAVTLIGYVGMGFESGLNGFFSWALPGCVLTILFVSLFGRMLRRLRLYTTPDLFALRFGRNAALVPALYQIVVYTIPTLAIQFIGLGIAFRFFFGLELQWGILMSFTIITLYTLLGGLPSTILTDCIQAAIIVLALTLMLAFGLHYAGGLDRIVIATPPDFWQPTGRGSFSSFLGVVFTVGPFYMVWQATWQKIYAARNEQTAVAGVNCGFVIAMFIGLTSFFIGIIFRGFIPLDTPPDLVFTTVVSSVFPPYLGAFIVVGLAAAIMSSADSFTMMGSASMARDIYQQFFKPHATRREMLTVARCSVVLMSLAAVVLAFNAQGIITIYILVLKIYGAGMVFPVLALMFWKRTTRLGVQAGMISGGLVTILWYLAGNPLVMESLAGYTASLTATLVFSLLSAHAADEQVRAPFFQELDVTEYRRRLSSVQPPPATGP
jgi:SSS family solute:Na+ symporter